MIKLTLLNPHNSSAVQTWRFSPQSSIKIGRSKSNEVTLYSAVVSRHHVEIKRKGQDWELISLGSNGTFCQGQRITRTAVENGMIIRLASSGPQLQIWTEQSGEEKPPEESGKKISPDKSTEPEQPESSSGSQVEKAKETRTD